MTSSANRTTVSDSLARRLCASVTVGVALMLAAGCTGSGVTPDPPSPTLAPYDAWRPAQSVTTPPMTEAERAAGRQRFLNKFVVAYKLENPPKVALVRYVGRDEWSSVIAKCYTEAGFPAEPTSDGGISFPGDGVGNSQESAFNAADWECQSKYTLDPIYDVEYTDEQLGLVWDYNTEWLMPCLAAHGSPAQPGPSRETYIASFRTGDRWDPLNEASDRAPSMAVFNAIQADCPRYPSTAALYGS